MRRLLIPLPHRSLGSAVVAALASLLVPAAIAGLASGAAAQDVPAALAAYAKLPTCSLNKDGTRLAVEPCRTAAPKADMPRRAVTEMIAPMPSVALARPAAAPPAPVLGAPASSRGPQALVGCDAGGCRDAGGVRHNTGSGNATVTPSGKLCNINGIWLQCS